MHKFFSILMIVALLGLGVVFGYSFYERSQIDQPVSCTAKAKLCPDGSAVGRTGPKCGFATCPAVELDEGIKAMLTESILNNCPVPVPEIEPINASTSPSVDLKRIINSKYLQAALQIYYNLNGSYPDSLSTLYKSQLFKTANLPILEDYIQYIKRGDSSYELTISLEGELPQIADHSDCPGTTNQYCKFYSVY